MCGERQRTEAGGTRKDLSRRWKTSRPYTRTSACARPPARRQERPRALRDRGPGNSDSEGSAPPRPSGPGPAKAGAGRGGPKATESDAETWGEGVGGRIRRGRGEGWGRGGESRREGSAPPSGGATGPRGTRPPARIPPSLAHTPSSLTHTPRSPTSHPSRAPKHARPPGRAFTSARARTHANERASINTDRAAGWEDTRDSAGLCAHFQKWVGLWNRRMGDGRVGHACGCGGGH